MDSNSTRPRTSRIGGLEQLGKYELVCVLARSDLGSLWASVVTYGDGVGQLMAVQRIVIRPGEEEALTEPIREGVDALKGITRPGLIPVVDFVVSPGRLGVVSEYVEGEPLRSLQNLATLKKVPIPPEVAVRLVLDMLEAEVALHGLAADNPALSKYVFGGVSPDSVLVTADGRAKLLNPGLAAVAAGLPSLSWHTAALAYRAPEHVSSGTTVDARTDVFVTGVILWELLAQRSLFQPKAGDAAPADAARGAKRGDQVAMAQRVLTAPIERLDAPALSLPVALSKAVADVVAKALDRDPAARYGSAREMAEALATAATGLTAQTAQVAQIVDTLASSTLTTRRSAIARAGVDLSPESRPARPAAAEGDAVFGSDWVTDAESGEADKIHALGAGALAMTPTPSAAIAVGPKPGATAPRTAGGVPRPPTAAKTPSPGAVKPSSAKPEPARPVAAEGAQAAKKGGTTGPVRKGTLLGMGNVMAADVAKAAAAMSASLTELAAGPKAEAKPEGEADEFGVDVDMPEDEIREEAISMVPVEEAADASAGKPGRKPPPPPAVRVKSPEPSPRAPVAVETKGTTPEKPAEEIPAPPAALAPGANAFMSEGGDDAFSSGDDPFAAPPPAPEVALPAAPEAAPGGWIPPGSAAAGPAESAEAEAPSEEAATEQASPSSDSEPGAPRLATASATDEDFDEVAAMAAQRRRKGFIALGVVGGLVLLVGIGAVIHMATKGSSEGQTAATATQPPAPTPTPEPTPAATPTPPAETASAQPIPPPEPTASAEPPAPTDTATAAAATQTAPPATKTATATAKPPTTAKPGGGRPSKPGKPAKPYTPSGI